MNMNPVLLFVHTRIGEHATTLPPTRARLAEVPPLTNLNCSMQMLQPASSVSHLGLLICRIISWPSSTGDIICDSGVEAGQFNMNVDVQGYRVVVGHCSRLVTGRNFSEERRMKKIL